MKAHVLVSTMNGPVGMRYFCPRAEGTLGRVKLPQAVPLPGDRCYCCGATVHFDRKYASTYHLKRVGRAAENNWVLVKVR